MPGLDALVQRLAAQGRRDLRLADQLQVDRQSAALQEAGEVLGFRVLVKPPEIWAPGAAVDPVRVLGEVDDRPRLDFVVEDDGKVPRELFGFFGGDRPDRLALACLGDLPGHVVERFAAACR